MVNLSGHCSASVLKPKISWVFFSRRSHKCIKDCSSRLLLLKNFNGIYINNYYIQYNVSRRTCHPCSRGNSPIRFHALGCLVAVPSSPAAFKKLSTASNGSQCFQTSKLSKITSGSKSAIVVKIFGFSGTFKEF